MDVVSRSLPDSIRTQIARTLWRQLLQLRFRLFQQHRYNALVLEQVAGRPMLVLPEVFNPKLFRTGEFLATHLQRMQLSLETRVLDMGTGTGIGAIVAAERVREVVAVDINPAAVRCARINALLHRVEDRVNVLQGDLWEPVWGERFDLIMFNPPYFRGAPRDPLDAAWRADDVVERFARGLDRHLADAGQLLLVLSSDGDAPAFLATFEHASYERQIAAEKDFTNEVISIYRLVKKVER